MHSEYAVDPEAIAEDWKTCRYLSEMFGFDRGRLLSQFPKRWLPMAIEATGHLAPVEKLRVIEKLRRLKEHASIRSGRDYDPNNGTWVENALGQHAVAPFRAIVAGSSVAGHAEVVAADDVSETHPLFSVSRDSKIEREATTLVKAIKPLLRSSHQALLIDKYYDPFNSKYQKTLKEILASIAALNPGLDFEIHYCEHGRCPNAAAIEREAPTKFSGVIPAGINIKIYRWAEINGGLNFHARYILTDRGGVGVDAGFSSEGTHEQTDLKLLQVDFVQRTMALFHPNAAAYNLIRPIIQIASDGSVKHV